MEMSKRLVETSWFHAENFIWLFDASGSGWVAKPGIEKTVQVALQKITPKQQYTLLNKGNRLALLLPNALSLYRQKSKDHWRAANPGMAMNESDLPVNDTELNHPTVIVTHIEGVLTDSSRYYNPRCFSLNLDTLDTKNPHKNSLALYRNVNAIPLTRAGNVAGNLRSESGVPFSWALLTLAITIPGEDNLVLKTQANQFGDFIISLNELPALETDSLITDYSASLSIQACTLVDGIPDPDQVAAVQIKRISGGDNFIAALDLKIVPGGQQLLKSQGETALVVKAGA